MKRPADEPHAQVDALLWKASPRAPGGNSPRATTPAFKALPLPGHPLFPKVPPRLGGLLLPDVSGLGNGAHGDKIAQPPWKVARVDAEPAKAAPVPVEVRAKAMPEVPKGPATVAPRPQAPPWRAVPAVPPVPAVPAVPAMPERPKAGPVSGNSTASTGSTGGASFSKAAAAASSGLVPNPNDLLRRGEELLRQTAQLHQQNEIAHKKQEEERRKQEEIEKRRAEVEEKRRLEEERKRLVEEEQQNVRRQADEAAQVLQDELRKLIEVAELEVQMAEAESAKIDEPASCEEIVRVCEDFETAALAAQHAVKACFEFMDGRHLKLKGNTEATMSNCASLLKRSHAARASVDMVVLKVRKKAKPAKDEMLARSLQAELESLLSVAEEEAATVRKLQEALGKAQRHDGNDDQAVISACDDFDKPGQNALQAALRCTSLLDQNVKQIHGPTEELKARSTKLAGQARQLRSALDQILEKVRLAKMAAIQRIEKEARRVAAEKEAKRQEAIFDQYDQDKDGVLTAGEIVAYVKGEHHFDLAEEGSRGKPREAEKLQQILLNGSGVSKQHFARLRSQVAVIWSEILAKQRKERSEKQLLQLRKGAAEIQSALSGVEAEVVKAEAEVRHLPPMIKRAGMMMHQLYERTEAAETAIDAARDFLAAAKEQVFSLDKEIESEAKAMAQTEVRGLQMKVSLLENRLNHAANLTKTARNKLQLEEKKAELMQAGQKRRDLEDELILAAGY
eukprot:s1071_g7.t3